MDCARKAPAGDAPRVGLDEELTALFRRLCARPPPPHLLDLVAQLDAAFPDVRREPVLGGA